MANVAGNSANDASLVPDSGPGGTPTTKRRKEVTTTKELKEASSSKEVKEVSTTKELKEVSTTKEKLTTIHEDQEEAGADVKGKNKLSTDSNQEEDAAAAPKSIEDGAETGVSRAKLKGKGVAVENTAARSEAAENAPEITANPEPSVRFDIPEENDTPNLEFIDKSNKGFWAEHTKLQLKLGQLVPQIWKPNYGYKTQVIINMVKNKKNEIKYKVGVYDADENSSLLYEVGKDGHVQGKAAAKELIVALEKKVKRGDAAGDKTKTTQEVGKTTSAFVWRKDYIGGDVEIKKIAK